LSDNHKREHITDGGSGGQAGEERSGLELMMPSTRREKGGRRIKEPGRRGKVRARIEGTSISGVCKREKRGRRIRKLGRRGKVRERS
jgi:hypothetical protein